MMRPSPFEPHQGRPYGSDHSSSVASAPSAVSIKPIRDALEDGSAIDRRKRADDLSRENGQDSSQTLGRQFGRRPRYRLQRQEP